MKNLIELFIEAFESASRIPFQEEWKNTTGYLDGAPYNDLDVGRYSFVDDYGRKGIIINKGGGHSVVLFQRYTGDMNVLVTNERHDRYNEIISGSKISLVEIDLILKDKIPRKEDLKKYFFPEAQMALAQSWASA